jgi:hypothetical protein
MQIFWKGTNQPLGRVAQLGAGLSVLGAATVVTTESVWAFAILVFGFVVNLVGLAIDRGEHLPRLSVFAGTLIALAAALVLAARMLSERQLLAN